MTAHLADTPILRTVRWGPLGWTEMVSYIDPDNDRSIALVYRHPRPEPLQ